MQIPAGHLQILKDAAIAAEGLEEQMILAVLEFPVLGAQPELDRPLFRKDILLGRVLHPGRAVAHEEGVAALARFEGEFAFEHLGRAIACRLVGIGRGHEARLQVALALEAVIEEQSFRIRVRGHKRHGQNHQYHQP